MSQRKRRLESTVSLVQKRYGVHALRKGSDLARQAPPPGIGTGFAGLDAITGCTGLPLGAMTLLDGHTTSGKLTLAYKTLANAQHSSRRKAAAHPVAIVDLARSSDPDYLTRCGVDLEHLLVVRPNRDKRAVDLLLDLVRSQRVRLVLVDSLADLVADYGVARHLNAMLDPLVQTLRQMNCTLLLVDEPSPPWQRWLNLDRSWNVRQKAALHLAVQREQWLEHDGDLVGYQAQVRVLKSRWAPHYRAASIEIRFNGTVQARETW